MSEDFIIELAAVLLVGVFNFFIFIKCGLLAFIIWLIDLWN